jgi:hypothetical protein
VVEQPRDLGQVQADELRVKKQGGIVWMALAMMVQTRLWLGGEVSAQRDMTLIRRLRACLRIPSSTPHHTRWPCCPPLLRLCSPPTMTVVC